jgi:hypothetical protein
MASAKVITFTGGLGAQLISAAAYFHCQRQGIPVLAHFGYFAQQARVARVGEAGTVSHWAWALGDYGLEFAQFDQPAGAVDPAQVVFDGIEKLELGFAGLRDESIRARFPIDEASRDALRGIVSSGRWAALHVRRGDYLNVVTYLIPDQAYFNAALAVRRLVDHIVVISDTEIGPGLTRLLQSLPTSDRVTVVTGGTARLAHDLMRLSDILVASNSQLSYTAGALRAADQLTLFPSRHEGEAESDTNRWLRSLGEFQLPTRL